jgi:hypothetical protein
MENLSKKGRKQAIITNKRVSDAIPLKEKADEAKFPSTKVFSANLRSHNKRENMRETFSLQNKAEHLVLIIDSK